jgi:hypothetical protein
VGQVFLPAASESKLGAQLGHNMPWKHHTDDGFVEVIVNPVFQGNLISLAASRPVWIVDTQGNRALIDSSFVHGETEDLYEISRCSLPASDDPESCFFAILDSLDDHYWPYAGIMVHGLKLSPELVKRIRAEAFDIARATDDGFVATMIPEERGALIGRIYPRLFR